ncbi:MAG TPA: type I polyketide synthase, partial [Kofleriaceae bacterium]|nr:type I polyketide synthase [Kofleriaceae bacterium]
AAPATIDIAVIGLSCRLPGADSAAAYWQNLCDGRDVIGEIPADRWSLDGFYDPDPAAEGKSYSKWGGFLSDVGHFDPLFFGISPREAELTDPQQRLFLEESYKALEDAGYSAAALDGLRASVFVGCKDGDYVTKLGPSADPSYRLIGNTLSILAARISYFLNLKGPSIPVDTACSSSLVAIHLACQSLLTGDSELAIAGGVALMITPVSHVMLSKTGMLSPTGRCHTFDATADGLVPSEGVAVVVLKPLAAALRDRNHVYGVIRASETNQDGRSNGITAPSSSSQTALELDVYRRSGLHPETIGYVEAHGTGTRLGDPIEVDALTDAFAAFTDRKAFCPIGSVKASIGHTLAASGAASLIKVLLGLEHRTLVPSLHFEQPSPHIDFTRSPFYVNTERRDWPAGETPRRAAVSAFGMSGTNVHMIVEEAPAEARRSAPTIAPFTLVPLSAKTAASLRQKAVDLLAWLDRGVAHELGDLGFTLGTGRSHFAQRAAFVVRNSDDLHGQLVTWLAQPPASAPEPRPSADVQQRAAQLVRDAAAQDATGGLADRLHALADLYRQRVDLDWAALYTGQNRRLISLPSYPFLGRRYWVEETVASVPAVIAAGTAPAVIAADDAPVAYFGASWAPRATEGGPPPRGTVLLLGAPSLHRELAAVGPVIAVERGPWFRDMGDQRYQIAPDQDGDIARLLESLDRGGHRPRHVVHGWALDTLDTDQADPAAPFHAIAALCRGLAARSGPVRIVHAYRERRDRRDASHAAIASLARSLRLDVPQLALTTAAVDDASALPIAAELASGDSAVRYRNGQRTVQVLRPWRASGVHGPAPRTGGVYLITGGLGGLGRAFAAH